MPSNWGMGLLANQGGDLGKHRGGVDDIESTARVEGVIAALGRDFQNHGHDLRRLIRAIASSDAFQRVIGQRIQ